MGDFGCYQKSSILSDLELRIDRRCAPSVRYAELLVHKVRETSKQL